jgi:phosphohistidine phosphatase
MGLEVEAVLASSFARAWQTAEILAEEANWPAAEACPALEPPSSAAACADFIRTRGDSSIALVGHEPQLSELVSLLLVASEHAVRLELKKGGIVGLRFADRATAGGGTLRWSLSPKVLRGLDG